MTTVPRADDPIDWSTLTDAERDLARCGHGGTKCEPDGPIRGAVLAALLANEVPEETDGTSWKLHRRGLELSAHVTGVVDLSNAMIQAPLRFKTCTFDDRIVLDNATSKSVDFDDCTLKNGLRGDGLHVEGSLYFRRGTTVEGAQVRLLHGHIDRNLYCVGAEFSSTVRATDENEQSTYSFTADGTRVDGAMFWLPEVGADGQTIETQAAGAVKLTGTAVGGLNDEVACWPSHVAQREFVYESLMSNGENRTLAKRLDFVRRNLDDKSSWWTRFRASSQDHYPFSPQPYQQLAAVFRELGRGADARDVLYARWHDELAGGPSRPGRVPAWLLRSFLHVTVGNGYRTRRMVIWVVVAFLIGLVVVNGAVDDEALVRADNDEAGNVVLATACDRTYACLNEAAYVADILLPIDLGEADEFRIDETKSGPVSWISWEALIWVGVAVGWILTITLGAAFTPLVRRE